MTKFLKTASRKCRVAMESFPYSAMQMTASEVETILNILHQLQQHHHASFKMDLEFSFKSFSLFRNYVDVDMGPIIDLSGENQIYLSFPHLSYTLHSASRYYVPPSWEYQSWGIVNLRKKFGHILVQTETLWDKARELIHPIEIDFENDPEFSKRFYVLAGTENDARSFFSAAIRECFKKYWSPDFLVEISNDYLVVGNKKTINLESALRMGEFMVSLSSVR